MLNNTVVLKFTSKLSDPRYASLLDKAKYDFEVVSQKLNRAKVSLAMLQSCDFKKCVNRFSRGEFALIKIRSTSLGIQGDIKFKSQKTYRNYVVGQFFCVLNEICSSADVLGGLLKESYLIANPGYSFPTTYFQSVLGIINANANPSNLKTLLASEPSILDHLTFLPATPVTNIELADCHYSYILARKLRNLPEHNSYEDFISFVASSDSVALRGEPEYFATISDKADVILGFTDFWPRLSSNKNGSRDLCKFSEWILEQSILCLEKVIDVCADDL